MPGPIPRPESELARPRARKGGDQQAVSTGIRQDVVWTEPPAHWGDLARDMYYAAQDSGQADFYQQSDVAYMTFVLEEMNRYMEPQSYIDRSTGEEVTYTPKRSGQMFQALHSSMQALLFTEGDRRRVRVELAEQPVERPRLASVAKLAYADVAGGPAPEPEK